MSSFTLPGSMPGMRPQFAARKPMTQFGCATDGQPHFAGRSFEDGDDRFGSFGSDRSGQGGSSRGAGQKSTADQDKDSGHSGMSPDTKKKLLKGGAAAAVLLALSPVFNWMFLEQSVEKGEACVNYSKNSGYGTETMDEGRFTQIPFVDKFLCTTADNDVRVTEAVRVFSGGIPVNARVSVGFVPNKQILPFVMRDVYGTGGTADPLQGPDPDVQPSKIQIEGNADSDATDGQRNLAAIYENAVWSENLAMIRDVMSLVPPDLAPSDADASQFVSNAIMHGYKPSDAAPLWQRSVATQIGGDKSPELERLLKDTTHRPGLQERITNRYADRMREAGLDPSKVSPILITDADMKLATPDNRAFMDALQSIKTQPLLQQNAREQQTTNRLTGDAEVTRTQKQAEAAAKLDTPEARNVYCIDKTLEAVEKAKGGPLVTLPNICGGGNQNTPSLIVNSGK